MTADVSMHPFWQTHQAITTTVLWCEDHGDITVGVDDAVYCPGCGDEFPTEGDA